MPEHQSSSQPKKRRSSNSTGLQKSRRTGKQTAVQKLGEYKNLLQEMHDLLLPENDLQEVLRDEKRVPTFQTTLRAFLAWIKKVEKKEEIINTFTDVLEGKEIELFKESIEKAIFHFSVILDMRDKEKEAWKEGRIDILAKLRFESYEMLNKCRKCIFQSLQLLK